MTKLQALKKAKHIHFMGISGSGCSAAALLAKAAGFKVSGCDLEPDSAYAGPLKKLRITPKKGHDPRHLARTDLLVVSPSVLASNAQQPEVEEAKKRGILLTWQEFVGTVLQENKEVLAIAGTHGKTTVTAMIGLILEAAGLDPTVLVGGLVPDWQSSVRVGASPYFVGEADEYNDNFLHYSPSLALINNIEMDHPEFFRSYQHLLKSFRQFITRLRGQKILVVNTDDPGVRRILTKEKESLASQGARVIGYHLGAAFDFPLENDLQAQIIELGKFKTKFLITFRGGAQEAFSLRLPGRHNVYNALAAFASAQALGIGLEPIKKVLAKFAGVKRRLDLLGEARGVKVVDDYGHHPTQIEATLNGLKQLYPEARIWAVFEPHQISRLKIMPQEFAASLKKADRVIVTKIFWGREKKEPGLEIPELVTRIGRGKARSIEKFSQVSQIIYQEAQAGEVVVVFGAGESSRLAKMIFKKLGS